MKWSIGIASGGCVERSVLDVIDAIHRSGVTGVELGTPPRHFDPWNDEQVSALRDHFSRLSLAAVSIHAPFGGLLDLAEPNPHHRTAAISAVLTAASALKRVGGRIVVVHPSDLLRDGTDVDARLADCVASLNSLSTSCRQQGLTLAIESPLPHLIGGHPDEFAWILERVAPSVGVCLDTGHTRLGNHWHRFMHVAGDRLIHVHASDNGGHRDDHLPPGDGCIDWREIARTLRDAQFTGWMMLELSCPGNDLTGYFQRARTQAEALLNGA